MKTYVEVHVGRGDRVVPGLVRPGVDDVVRWSVKVAGAGEVILYGEPRVLRRIAEELLDAADVACRREDALTDTPLFEAVQ